jgi:hypothetical protein
MYGAASPLEQTTGDQVAGPSVRRSRWPRRGGRVEEPFTERIGHALAEASGYAERCQAVLGSPRGGDRLLASHLQRVQGAPVDALKTSTYRLRPAACPAESSGVSSTDGLVI